jgi:hypothetical protein
MSPAAELSILQGVLFRKALLRRKARNFTSVAFLQQLEFPMAGSHPLDL